MNEYSPKVEQSANSGIDLYSEENITPSADQVREIKFYWHMATAKDQTEFKARLLSILSHMGFSDFVFAPLSSQYGAYGNILCTLDDLWKTYLDEQHYQHDMILQHCMKCSKPILTSTMYQYISSAPFKTEQFQRNIEWIELCTSRGYNDAYNIPLQASNDENNVVLSVFAKDLDQAAFRRLVEQNKTVLFLLVEAINYIGTHKFPDMVAVKMHHKKQAVTPKSLRLLHALTDGNMSLKEAAVKLCISIDTANKHVAAIKKALEAKTQAAAVYQAIKKGLLDPDPQS
ncbi:MAG: autoinducer binding domain-containing protein [Exilibacterium sp.]